MNDRKIPETLEDAMTEIKNRVYEATSLLEDLEQKGLVAGKIHYSRQVIAETAAQALKRRWRGWTGKPPSPPYGEGGPGSDSYLGMQGIVTEVGRCDDD